jgi:hypothetical protein
MMLSQDRPTNSHEWHDPDHSSPRRRIAGRGAEGAIQGAEQRLQRDLLLAGVLATLVALAGNMLVRQWLVHAILNICVLGGIFAAPLVSVLAWIGLLLPPHAPLHQLAPTLVCGSLIWFSLAIAGAHAFRRDPSND